MISGLDSLKFSQWISDPDRLCDLASSRVLNHSTEGPKIRMCYNKVSGKLFGPYSRKRNDFSPGISLTTQDLINLSFVLQFTLPIENDE